MYLFIRAVCLELGEKFICVVLCAFVTSKCMFKLNPTSNAELPLCLIDSFLPDDRAAYASNIDFNMSN